MYDVESISKSVQGSCSGMQATKNGKLCCNIKQVDGSMMGKVLFFFKYCPKSETKLFSINCELSQGATLENESHKNIAFKEGDELVVFDCQEKTNDD